MKVCIKVIKNYSYLDLLNSSKYWSLKPARAMKSNFCGKFHKLENLQVSHVNIF